MSGLSEVERALEDWLIDHGGWPDAYDLSHALAPFMRQREQAARDAALAPVEALVSGLSADWDASTGGFCADCDKVRDGLDILLAAIRDGRAT